jgi:hypothetical protein
MPEVSSAAAIDTPQSAPPAGSLNVQYPQWQAPYPYSKPVGSSGDSYDLWSAHSAPQQPSDTRNSGPLGYAYGDPTGGSYYPPPPTPGR